MSDERTGPELLTPAEMAEADRLTIASGTPGATLMRRASRAVADVVARMVPLGTRILVLCGRGNNGGDGYGAARILLRERGYPTVVAAEGPPDERAVDAVAMAKAWDGPVIGFDAVDCEPPDLVVDALLGAGLTRDVDGATRALIERINASGCRVVAVDLPSGVDGATGAVRGVAIQATETVTFARMKPGHVLLPGRLQTGVTRLADIGIENETVAKVGPKAFVNGPAIWRQQLALPSVAGHKYSRGHAVVVSGPLTATGAARLAARGALRAGAGLVTLASPLEALGTNAAHLTAIMLAPMEGPAGLDAILADPRKNAVGLGPGLGVDEGTRALTRVALASGASVVLDADALTSFAGDLEGLASLIKARPERPVVLTPHGGEFARLFRSLIREEGAHRRSGSKGASKLELAREAAALSGAVVVLKGADTVVASPDGRASVATNAPPWLATAGSGDVLAGIVTGLLAQRMPGFEAASAAVWLHGEAGQVAGIGLIAEDLPEALPKVWAGLLED
ncbi:MAG: NAD(P)H-hydrate dehydratase [Alphaproteobacteria bacterium]